MNHQERTPVKLSITIVSFNTRKVTRDALLSIRDNISGVDYEIIVVDNGSGDGSAEMIRQEFPAVQLVCNDRNLGFAQAQNIAIKRARGDYVLILNSDTIMTGNAAHTMIESMQSSGERVGFLGPRVTDAHGTVRSSTRRKLLYPKFMIVITIVNQFLPFGRLIPLGLIRKHFRRVFGRIHDAFDPPEECLDVEWVDGVCVLCRRRALEEIGLFDEQFFFGGEIGDLLCRGRRAGWRVLYEPTAHIVHLRGYSRRHYKRARFHSQMGHLRFYAKQFPDYAGLVRRTYLTILPLAAAGERVVGLFSNNAQKRQDRLAYLKETRRAMREFKREQVWDDECIPTLVANDELSVNDPAARGQVATGLAANALDGSDIARSSRLTPVRDVKS